MKISRLALTNFRNHRKKIFSFSSDLTFIIGKNASGKTNLIEAIFFLSIGKSFRMSSKDSQTITFGEELARIKGEIEADRDNKSLEIIITYGEVMRVKTPLKKFLVDGVSRRNIDFTGNLRSVLFWPENMELVTDSPFLRRRYLDYVLVQVDREYRRTQISYERGLRQRNKLLENIREGQAHEHQLMFWDQLLIKQGNYITEKREEYTEFINRFKLPSLEKSGVSYQLFYDKSIISKLRLEQYKDAEIASGATLVGPHRDDIKFKIHPDQIGTKFKTREENFWDLASFGSRGEQRLAVLWLKLAELDFIKVKTGENPLLLLDDIFSELDHEHRELIFSMIGNQQSILTVTDRHLIPEIYYKKAQVIELELVQS